MKPFAFEFVCNKTIPLNRLKSLLRFLFARFGGKLKQSLLPINYL